MMDALRFSLQMLTLITSCPGPCIERARVTFLLFNCFCVGYALLTYKGTSGPVLSSNILFVILISIPAAV